VLPEFELEDVEELLFDDPSPPTTTAACALEQVNAVE